MIAAVLLLSHFYFCYMSIYIILWKVLSLLVNQHYPVLQLSASVSRSTTPQEHGGACGSCLLPFMSCGKLWVMWWQAGCEHLYVLCVYMVIESWCRKKMRMRREMNGGGEQSPQSTGPPPACARPHSCVSIVFSRAYPPCQGGGNLLWYRI